MVSLDSMLEIALQVSDFGLDPLDGHQNLVGEDHQQDEGDDGGSDTHDTDECQSTADEDVEDDGEDNEEEEIGKSHGFILPWVDDVRR